MLMRSVTLVKRRIVIAPLLRTSGIVKGPILEASFRLIPVEETKT